MTIEFYTLTIVEICAARKRVYVVAGVRVARFGIDQFSKRHLRAQPQHYFA